jgi:fructokinase
MIIAAVEAGGTKFIAGLLRITKSKGEGPEVLWRSSIPTTSPSATLEGVAELLRGAAKTHGRPELLGIACFGPVELKRSSPDWGHITTTPKPGWRGADVAPLLGSALGLRAAFDTDVNAAACGELLWGAARGLSDFVYMTVGTGIGGGAVAGGRLVHGAAHPEFGHLRIAREEGDEYKGHCPYHGDCFEGLACGPAIAERWGRPATELPEEHPAWKLEASYLARAFAAYTCVLSPQRILMGGGIGLRPGLAELVTNLVGRELAGYFAYLDSPERLSGYVRRPDLGANAGLFGAAALALGGGEGG